MMIAAALLGVALALTPAASASPAPAQDTQTVFTNSANSLLFAEPSLTSTVLRTLHEGDVLNVPDPTVIVAGTGNFVAVEIDGVPGFVSANIVIPTPQITITDLTDTYVVAKPEVGGGAGGQAVIGTPTLRLLPAAASTAMVQASEGEVLTCAPDEVSGPAGVLGDVQWFACITDGDTRIGYIRAEWAVPYVDLADIAIDGSTVAQGDTPVYETPAATGDPIAMIARDTRVSVGTPTGEFTPVEYEDQRGYAPTKILGGVETLSDRIKEKATDVWGKTKEVASDAKDKVDEAVSEAKDKVDESPAGDVFAGVRDLPALILSLVLALATLALAWMRRLGVLPLPRIARRALNVAAVLPLLILASVAPIGTYAWLLWVVLGVTGAVAAGVFSGFRPTFSRTREVVRTRKAQIIAGAALTGGALLGAVTTGFAGWVAPLAAGVVSLAGALGYLLSAPAEKPAVADETGSAPERPATPAANEPTPAVVEPPVTDETGAIR